MIIDVVKWMVMNPVDALTQYLSESNANPLVLSTILTTNQIQYIKSSKGYPYEINPFDDDNVYQLITDSGDSWVNSSAFKMFASKTWPMAFGGLLWCKRFVDLSILNLSIVTKDSTYRIYTGCSKYTTLTLNGPIETQILGIFNINFGGDLLTKDALIHTYMWGPGYSTMELNYYVEDLGRVRWETYNLVNGVYLLQKSITYNTIVKGKSPALVMPCGIPLL